MIGIRGSEMSALFGFAERQLYVYKRYWVWEVVWLFYSIVSVLSIGFLASGLGSLGAVGGSFDLRKAQLYLLIGALLWGYLSLVFMEAAYAIAWERWEGTIEYTFMAPLPRAVHLLGMGAFAVLYGVLRTAALFGVVAIFFGLSFPDADFGAALLLLAVASISFVGVGMVTAVLPLISPEKGAQLGFIAQGLLLVVSGVYYPVDVMPGWMQAIATISPATYALEGIRAAVLDGAGVGAVWGDLWPLLVLGVVAIPAGLAVFRAGERYAKRTGSLKRNG